MSSGRTTRLAGLRVVTLVGALATDSSGTWYPGMTGAVPGLRGADSDVRNMHLLVRGAFTDQASWARVIRNARCADASLDADQWFPVSAEAGKARQEAAAAIAVCSTCMVRAQCLALSLRHWDIGQHGVWGGLVAAERAALRRRI
jgi:hypothetical protein